MHIPHSLGDVNAEWLTATLVESGAMPQGVVDEIHVRAETRLDEMRVHLQVDYDGPAPLSLPRFMLLRYSLPTPTLLQAEGMRGEVGFCRHAAPSMQEQSVGLPVPQIYAAGFERQTGRGFVLEQAIDQTHQRYSGPMPLSLDQLRQTVDALATLHGYWWDHDQLQELTELPNMRQEDSYISQVADVLPSFLEEIGPRMTQRYSDLFWRALDGRRALTTRILSGTDYSLRNSAPHPEYLAFANNPQLYPVLITNWRLWCASVAVHDLNLLLGCSLPTVQRRKQERYLLRRYWQRLCDMGVSTYSWPSCWRDYCQHTAAAVFTPMWRWVLNKPTWAWWPMIQPLLTAFDDLYPEP